MFKKDKSEKPQLVFPPRYHNSTEVEAAITIILDALQTGQLPHLKHRTPEMRNNVHLTFVIEDEYHEIDNEKGMLHRRDGGYSPLRNTVCIIRKCDIRSPRDVEEEIIDNKTQELKRLQEQHAKTASEIERIAREIGQR